MLFPHRLTSLAVSWSLAFFQRLVQFLITYNYRRVPQFTEASDIFCLCNTISQLMYACVSNKPFSHTPFINIKCFIREQPINLCVLDDTCWCVSWRWSLCVCDWQRLRCVRLRMNEKHFTAAQYNPFSSDWLMETTGACAFCPPQLLEPHTPVLWAKHTHINIHTPSRVLTSLWVLFVKWYCFQLPLWLQDAPLY